MLKAPTHSVIALAEFTPIFDFPYFLSTVRTTTVRFRFNQSLTGGGDRPNAFLSVFEQVQRSCIVLQVALT